MPTDWYGWAGRILRVDLTHGEVSKEPLPEEMAHNFLGGRNINSKILFDEVAAGTDPLGPENKLIIGTGPLTGTLGPGTGRFTLTAKSPLTGILGDANSGGHFGAELKYAGYDHVIIQGKANKPVYIFINDDNVEIRDADHLWGKTVFEADRVIRMEDIGDREIRTLIIGPAGENLVRFACPINDLYRAPGRCGMGAVMGSKNLKAVAVRGTKSVRIARPKEYIEFVRQIFQWIYQGPLYKDWSTLGTTVLPQLKQQRGEISVRNYQDNYWTDEKARKVSGEEFVKSFAVKSKGCFGCPIHCGHAYVVRQGEYAGTYAGGLEWGAICPLGPNFDNPNLASICKLHELACQYGLDILSAGNIIAFATELWERGLISKKETGGMVLRWGDHRLLVDLFIKIARREGFGNLLADGLVTFAKRVGKGAEKYAYHIKGLDDATDARSDVGRALGYAVASRGQDHLRGLPTYALFEGSSFKDKLGEKYSELKFGAAEASNPRSYHPIKADIVIHSETHLTAADALEMCKFATEWIGFAKVDINVMAKLASLVTGIPFTGESLAQICERGCNVERAFNVREGLTAEDDLPPPKALEPIPSGPQKGAKIDLDKFKELLKEYYEKRGWDRETGIPTQEKLRGLGLQSIADELARRDFGRPAGLRNNTTKAGGKT